MTLGTGDPVGVSERCSVVGVALALGCVAVGAPRLFAPPHAATTRTVGGNKIGRRPERLPIASLVQLSERCAIDPRPSYLLGFEYRMRGLSMKTRERYPASIPTYTPCYRGFAISSVLSVGVRIIYSVSDRPTAGPHGAEAARELRRGFLAHLVGSPEITKDLHHYRGLDHVRCDLQLATGS